MEHFLPTSTAYDEKVRLSRAALLPIGSFEQHGRHLPLITDTIVACAIAHAIAEIHSIHELPPVTISCSHEHMRWAGTVAISSVTLQAIVTDVVKSLGQSGIASLVLVNAHGGNYVLANVVQEATSRGDSMILFPTDSDWRKARTEAGIETTSESDMHAGELETSILLHAYPSLVRPDYMTSDWIADDRKHLLTLGMEGYTESGVIGRPSLATAAKGKAVLGSLLRSFTECASLIDNWS